MLRLKTASRMTAGYGVRYTTPELANCSSTMPQTLTGWILLVAIMVSSTWTIAAGIKLTSVMQRRGKEDQRDLYLVYALGTLLMLSTLVFMFVESR